MWWWWLPVLCNDWPLRHNWRVAVLFWSWSSDQRLLMWLFCLSSFSGNSLNRYSLPGWSILSCRPVTSRLIRTELQLSCTCVSSHQELMFEFSGKFKKQFQDIHSLHYVLIPEYETKSSTHCFYQKDLFNHFSIWCSLTINFSCSEECL